MVSWPGNLIVVDAKAKSYAVYKNGKHWHTVQSDRLLEPDEVEAFRRDPHGYIYGEDPEPSLA